MVTLMSMMFMIVDSLLIICSEKKLNCKIFMLDSITNGKQE